MIKMLATISAGAVFASSSAAWADQTYYIPTTGQPALFDDGITRRQAYEIAGVCGAENLPPEQRDICDGRDPPNDKTARDLPTSDMVAIADYRTPQPEKPPKLVLKSDQKLVWEGAFGYTRTIVVTGRGFRNARFFKMGETDSFGETFPWSYVYFCDTGKILGFDAPTEPAHIHVGAFDPKPIVETNDAEFFTSELFSVGEWVSGQKFKLDGTEIQALLQRSCNAPPKSGGETELFLTEFSERRAYSMSTELISVSGSRRSVWMNSYDYRAFETWWRDEIPKNPYTFHLGDLKVESRVRYEFDCGVQKYRALSFIEYGPEGKVSDSGSGETAFEPIAPGTIAQSMAELTCLIR